MLFLTILDLCILPPSPVSPLSRTGIQLLPGPSLLKKGIPRKAVFGFHTFVSDKVSVYLPRHNLHERNYSLYRAGRFDKPCRY